MEVKDSPSQGRRREAGSEGRLVAKTRADEQKPDTRRERRASRLMTAKPISIKDAKRKSGGRASKTVELTSGYLSGCPQRD